MATTTPVSLHHHFANLSDPRVEVDLTAAYGRFRVATARATRCHRPLNALCRLLDAHHTLHGHWETAASRLRGWAWLLNFRPFEPQAHRRTGYQSTAHRLNKRAYRAHWLHNLYISASLGGFRA